MLDLNRLPEGSSEGSIPASNLPMVDMVDSHDESVVGYPTIHDYQLNQDSDNGQEDNEPVVVPQGTYGFQRGCDDDPVDEFEVGQQFQDKEAVLLTVNTYSIKRVVEYKFLESDRLKYW
ncbi:hypothetical protein PIB30_008495 [Stylosanthes scabra]|uniref:Uncharacterized protein n=1 Tax=Stylosanthes scabra TaxID=79078 RepID=A0ABU6Y6L5_9FABA|nr:hypothetical protein [Stylosanthes scabra]